LDGEMVEGVVVVVVVVCELLPARMVVVVVVDEPPKDEPPKGVFVVVEVVEEAFVVVDDVEDVLEVLLLVGTVPGAIPPDTLVFGERLLKPSGRPTANPIATSTAAPAESIWR
jgi:hypothetical protein